MEYRYHTFGWHATLDYTSLAAHDVAMSDVQTRSRRVADPGPVTVNTELFLAACAAKGASNYIERGKLLGKTDKQTWQWATGQVEPKYYTACRIAKILGVEPSDLWPGCKQ